MSRPGSHGSEPRTSPRSGALFRTLPAGVREPTRTVDIPDDQLTTTLATLTYRAPELGERWPRHLLETLVFCALGFAFGHVVGREYAGVVSLFLASAALSSRFKQILRRQRRHGPTQLVLAIAPIGLGALLAYGLICSALGPDGVRERFAFAVAAAGIVGEGELSPERFRGSWGLLGHNLLVLLSAFVLAFVYRGFGVLLTILWNAAAWSAALVVLARPDVSAGLAIVALTPHFAVEGLAFICAALAGVGAGMHIAGNRGLSASIRLAAFALVALLVGAALESAWPGFVLARGPS